MRKPRPTLSGIRTSTSKFQKDLLEEIWQHFRAHGDWPILRLLYRDHGKEAVRNALLALGGSVGREENGPRRWRRYALTLLGVMLTRDGKRLQKLMVRLFEFQRDLFRKKPNEENSTSDEIKSALNLSSDDTQMLGQLIRLGQFGGGWGGKDESWTISAMEEAENFPLDKELSAEFETWILRHYQPDAAVFRDQPTRGHQSSDLFPFATASQLGSSSHPSEIALSLERLRAKYPDGKKLGFLIMRFTATKPFKRIVKAIKSTAEKYGLVVLRADEDDFHADLWGNVRTLLHGCGFGIAVYERIESNEPNANVGLEVGYLMAMNKPVLLLKDKTVAALQSDLTGKLYKPFDPHNPEKTLPKQLTKWLEDNGIIVPERM